MTSTYSGQVWPRSCETSAIAFIPEGFSPFQPFQVEVGQSQRPSCSGITGLQSSNKTNVIPAVATADIDVRLLPDQDAAEFLATLQQVVGDTAVHFTTLLKPKTPLESPIDTDLFHAIERAAHEREPSALVTTPMETAATDRPTYRRLGITTYGFSPFKVPRPEIQRGMHGNDERLSLENVGYGIHFYYDILRYTQ